MNKKGDILDLQLVWVIDIILFSFLIITYFTVDDRIKNSELHDIHMTAREFGMTYDAVKSAPQDVVYTLNFKNNLDVSFDKDSCTVLVKSKKKGDVLNSKFYCGKNNFLVVNDNIIENRVVLSKNEQKS